MKFVLPRVILGNRGDLASRWALLRTLHIAAASHDFSPHDITVFTHDPGDLPQNRISPPFPRLPYGRARNLLLPPAGRQALQEADVVLWAVGLDMQDDSSLAKLLYLWTAFRLYRALGLQVWVLFQGAGPLRTRPGRALARAILRQVHVFVARDPGTYRLIGTLAPQLDRRLAHDAIFLPGFEQDLQSLTPAETTQIDVLTSHLAGSSSAEHPHQPTPDGQQLTADRPLIGLNLRQWFHFTSSLIPYQFARRQYRQRGQQQMQQLLASAAELVERLRREQNARILLLSAYQPDIVPWEDDLPWLRALKARFPDDPQIVLVDGPLSLPAYYSLMSRLSLMIGMRLHSTLIALRLGVPAINLSYTLKGGDILNHLGLGDNLVDLTAFLNSPDAAYQRSAAILANRTAEASAVRRAVQAAIDRNLSVLNDLLSNPQPSPHHRDVQQSRTPREEPPSTEPPPSEPA